MGLRLQIKTPESGASHPRHPFAPGSPGAALERFESDYFGDTREAFKKAMGPAWNRLKGETHPEIFFPFLWSTLERAQHKDGGEWVKPLLHHLKEAPDFFGLSIPIKIRERAGRSLNVLEGEGPWNPRLHYQVSQFFSQVTKPEVLLAMGVASPAFHLVRNPVLNHLLQKPAGLLTRGLGLRTVAGAAGLPGEVLAFSATEHAYRRLAQGGTEQLSWEGLGREWGALGLTLGLFKAHGRLAQEFFPVKSRALRGLVAGGGMYSGIVHSHLWENRLGWRPTESWDRLLMGSFETFLQLKAMGKLSHSLMGSRYQAWVASLEARAEQKILSQEISSPSPWKLPDLFLGARAFATATPARVKSPPRVRGKSSNLWLSEKKKNGEDDPKPGKRDFGTAPTAFDKTRIPKRLPSEEETADTAFEKTEAPGKPARPEESADTALAQEAERRSPVDENADTAFPSQGEVPKFGQEQVETMAAPPASEKLPAHLTVPPTSHAEITVGMRLGEGGRYEVKQLLGEGGMGKVYGIVDHKQEGLERVIKVPTVELSEEMIARAERERKIGTHIKSDIIVRIFDFIEVGSFKIPVMEKVSGEDLSRVLREIRAGNPEYTEQKYPLEKRIQLAAKILEAVQELHEEGIVHRDLKPDNIRVTDRNAVKILDLGIAKDISEGDPEKRSMIPPSLGKEDFKNLTQAGSIFGTPGYMAPETIDPMTFKSNNPFSKDVFALGAILQEIITGYPAFVETRPGDPNKGEKQKKIPLREEDSGPFKFNFYRPLQLVEDMAPNAFSAFVEEKMPPQFYDLEKVARKAMAPQPKDRYQSAERLRQAVLLGPARLEKQRLDKMREEMAEAQRQIQEDSKEYRQVEISEEMWERWTRPIRFLQSRHESWHQRGQTLEEKILSLMGPQQWPEARRLIAQINWERLTDLGHRINPTVREALVEKIKENDLPLEDRTISGMKEALAGRVPLHITVRDYMSEKPVHQRVKVKVIPYEPELDAEGIETGNFKKGKILYNGKIANGNGPLELPAGFYVLKIHSPEYAFIQKPIQITLEDVRQGISKGRSLQLSLELVPRELVPKGMAVIPGGEFYIGDDPKHIPISPFELSSQPLHKIKIPTFLMDYFPTTVKEYREFLETKLQEIQEQIEAENPKIRQKEKDALVMEAIDPILPLQPPMTKETATLKERVASAVGKLRRQGEAEEDRFYWRLIKVKEEGKWIWKLNNPKVRQTRHGDHLDIRQPVDGISPTAALEYLRWRAQKDNIQHSHYRLGTAPELEGVARGGMPWTYPWGDNFDPFKTAGRSIFPDVNDAVPTPVGRHPVKKVSRDQSLFGPRDIIGNVREFTSTPEGENAISMLGGSVSNPIGPLFRPSTRGPLGMFTKFDSLGFRKVLNLPKKTKKD